MHRVSSKIYLDLHNNLNVNHDQRINPLHADIHIPAKFGGRANIR